MKNYPPCKELKEFSENNKEYTEKVGTSLTSRTSVNTRAREIFKSHLVRTMAKNNAVLRDKDRNGMDQSNSRTGLKRGILKSDLLDRIKGGILKCQSVSAKRKWSKTKFYWFILTPGQYFDSLHMGKSFMLVVCSFFTNLTFSKNYFRNTFRDSNRLYPDQDQHVDMPDLGPKSLQKLLAGYTSRLTIKAQKKNASENVVC